MEQGLSGRPRLTNSQGMLFNFGTSTTPGFWMKDMNFDLDFIWIRDGKIIGITPNVPAPAQDKKFDTASLPTYYPPSAVNQVLEVNAGWAEKNNVTVGDAALLMQK